MNPNSIGHIDNRDVGRQPKMRETTAERLLRYRREDEDDSKIETKPTMKTSFTQGQWKQYGRTVYAGETPIALGIAEFDAEVAPTYANDYRHPLKHDDEAEANARLIAAAPAMYQVLQLVLKRAELVPDEILDTARAAIKSATQE